MSTFNSFIWELLPPTSFTFMTDTMPSKRKRIVTPNSPFTVPLERSRQPVKKRSRLTKSSRLGNVLSDRDLNEQGPVKSDLSTNIPCLKESLTSDKSTVIDKLCDLLNTKRCAVIPGQRYIPKLHRWNYVNQMFRSALGMGWKMPAPHVIYKFIITIQCLIYGYL